MKDARARLHRARVDRACAEREAARAGVARAEADVETARASLHTGPGNWSGSSNWPPRGRSSSGWLTRKITGWPGPATTRGSAEAALKSARARLKSAEAYGETIRAEPGASDAGPGATPPATPRR